jgi:hypothetical protein
MYAVGRRIDMSEVLKGSVGDVAEHAITKIKTEDGQPAIGNVLRRLCQHGCQDGCSIRQQMKENDSVVEVFEMLQSVESERSCADLNLAKGIGKLGLKRDQVLMVGVTKNKVGFADQLDEYDVQQNPEGWRELSGFNAFFARTDEESALGRRLADCSDINYEFTDAEGKSVIGFEHGTRTNMTGESDLQYERDGKKVNFTEYVLGQAIDHYGADPQTIKIKLAAAIQGRNFTFTFTDIFKMEEVLPGWYSGGLLENKDNSNWAPNSDGSLNATDVWEADSRQLILHDIYQAAENLGIPTDNIDVLSPIDPAESDGMFSSQTKSRLGKSQASRDLYITYVGKDASDSR